MEKTGIGAMYHMCQSVHLLAHMDCLETVNRQALKKILALLTGRLGLLAGALARYTLVLFLAPYVDDLRLLTRA